MFPTALLIGAAGFVLVLRRLSDRVKVVRRALWFFGGAVSVYTLYLTFLQYQVWSDDGMGKFLLPEHQPTYFYFYSLTRFLTPYLISLTFGAIFTLLLIKINKRRGGVLFEDEEPYLAGLLMFLSGYPGVLVYFISVLIIYLFWHVVIRIKGKKDIRLPLYYLWPAAAILMMFILYSPFVHSDIWLSLKI